MPQPKWVSKSVRDNTFVDIELIAKLDDALQKSENQLVQDFGGWNGVVSEDRTQEIPKIRFEDVIGPQGLLPPTETKIAEFYDFYRTMPPPPFAFPSKTEMSEVRLADLGSVMDVAFILEAIDSLAETRRSPLRVLEIGGGYGRLVDAFSANFEGEFEWVMVDAIPSSLAGAWGHLSLIHGLQCNVWLGGEIIRSSTTPSTRRKVHIVGSWELESWFKAQHSCSLFVNIESFQEMNANQVAFYLEFLDRVTDIGSIFYESNSRDYFNRSPIQPSMKWVLERTGNTPRSWTADHPTNLYSRSN